MEDRGERRTETPYARQRLNPGCPHPLLLLSPSAAVLHAQPAPLVTLRACQLDRAPQVKQTEECLAYEFKLGLNANYGWATPR